MLRLSFAGALAAAAAMLAPSSSSAHHPGGAGNSSGAGPVVTFPATTLDQGQAAAFVIYDYIRLYGLSDADLIRAASRHEHAHSIKSVESTAVGGAFGVAENFTVSLRLPFVLRTDIREGAHAHVAGTAVNSVTQRGDASGVGDLTLLGQWRLLNNRATGTEAALLFGVKVPTGATGLRDRSVELFEAEFQPGSGSTDPILGAAVTQRFGAWALNANVLSLFVIKGTQYTNLADRFLYNAAVSYRLFGGGSVSAVGAVPGSAYMHAGHRPRHAAAQPHDHPPEPARAPALALDAVLELNGEWHGKQRIAGVEDPNSGGNTVYLAPGMRLSYANASGFLSVGVPVVNAVNGLQSKPSHRVVSGFAVSF